MDRLLDELGTEQTYYRIDKDGGIHPCASRGEWESWMEEHGKALRCLIGSGGTLKVGIKFLGKEHGWSENGNPRLWLAAILVQKKVITSMHVESVEEGFKKIQVGLGKVSKDAPWSKWFMLKVITWRLKLQAKGYQKKILAKL
jgi:hypothetical protein